jgi:quercetin dioxygenase-like cupin family protein
MDAYTIKRIDDLATVHGGMVKLAAADLGVESFGMQVLDFPAGFAHYPEHDHAEDGQEELYAALEGDGWLEIEGERVQLDAHTLVRVGPGTKRKLFSGPHGLQALVVGGVPGRTYEAPELTELSASGVS